MYVSLLFFHACLKGFRNSFSILLWWQLKLLFLSLFTTDIKLHLKGLNMASFSSPPLLDTFHVLLYAQWYHTPHTKWKIEPYLLKKLTESFLRSSGISGKYLAWKNFLLGNSRANFPFFQHLGVTLFWPICWSSAGFVWLTWPIVTAQFTKW